MKKIVAILSFIFFSFVEAKEVDLNQFKDIKMLNNPSVKLLKAVDRGTVYQIKVETQGSRGASVVDLFVTKDKKYSFIGSGYDNETSKMLVIAENMEQYKKDAAFVMGSGPNEYFLFTDPECPYCKRLEKKMLENKQIFKKVKIYVYMYPLSFHKSAKDMSYYILSKKTNEQKMLTSSDVIMGKDNLWKTAKYSKELKEKFEKELQKQMDVAQKVYVKGTPSLKDKDGQDLNYNILFQ